MAKILCSWIRTFPMSPGGSWVQYKIWVKILDVSSAPSDPYRCLCHHPSISVLTWSVFTFVENIFLLVACASEARVSPRTVLRNVLNVWWSWTYLLRIDKQQFCHETNANQKEKIRERCAQTVVMSFVCQRYFNVYFNAFKGSPLLNILLWLSTLLPAQCR